MKATSAILGLSGLVAAVVLVGGLLPAQSLIWERLAPPQQTGTPAYGRAWPLADVNGDGATDVLVSAFQASNGSLIAAGYFGVLSGIDGSVIYESWGSAQYQGLQANGSIGDIDRDGDGDFLRASLGLPLTIASGATGTAVGTVPWTSAGAAAPIGDVNGDGFGDFVIGPIASSTGSVQVYGGPSGTFLYQANGVFPGGIFGSNVAQLGDVNLDGIPDFLVGAPGTHIFEHSYVNGWAHICSGVDGSILRTWTGPSPRSLFGMAIASPGDLDGDGIPDVIVGAPNIRTIYVYSGATGAPIALQGTGGSSTQGGGAAHGIRGVGDVDGDGVPDYAYMGFFGQVNEIVVVSGATHAVLLRIPSPEPLLYFGSSLWAAGDVDGDGLPDLIAGSQTSNLYVPARVAMYSLRPQGQAFFGGGCPTASGHEPRIGGTAIPRRGQPFTFNLSRVPPSALAFLLVGTSNTAYGSTPLPFDLSSLGYPGCELLVSAEFVCPTFTFSRGANGGAAELTFQVPNDPLLLGVNFFAQWAVENLPPSLSPLAGTRGIHLVIQ